MLVGIWIRPSAIEICRRGTGKRVVAVVLVMLLLNVCLPAGGHLDSAVDFPIVLRSCW